MRIGTYFSKDDPLVYNTLERLFSRDNSNIIKNLENILSVKLWDKNEKKVILIPVHILKKFRL